MMNRYTVLIVHLLVMIFVAECLMVQRCMQRRHHTKANRHALTIPCGQCLQPETSSPLQTPISPLRLHATTDNTSLEEHLDDDKSAAILQDFFSMMRPITIIQAVGAFLVGRLVIILHSSKQSVFRDLPSIITASISIYLGYGFGMAVNDCADANVDSLHGEKAKSMTMRGRPPIPFGFTGWTLVNLSVMTGYSIRMQKLFLIKNLICGWLAVSPLIGATLLGGDGSLTEEVAAKLYRLAVIGFPLQVSREILKDIEDVDIDRVVGERTSKLIAYSLVAAVNAAMLCLAHYWTMFASTPPIYAVTVAIGVPMCIRAATLPLVKGQKLLKNSIYVLLAGMITSLLHQSR
ncbi:predicted protein [Thalassiosira pseudonana CCMP1335]|uniref:Uncharacterized protein n=1 Tax=Thalassiosira pseudonana TaxID=35128 RepID=B8BWG9_THAPS|nr:predicted protein [Thalassiosira pseudonana CCMP1335]EED94516.1 predicted protein [Thalassiosira pseudonana CCMP1335]